MLCVLLFAGCGSGTPELSLDPAYADAKVGSSYIAIRNGRVESYRVCMESENQFVALKYQQDDLSVEKDAECTPSEVTCAEFETFANRAIEKFGDIYQGDPYTLCVFDLMWEELDPAKVVDQDFYVYDLNTQEFVQAADWDKGYDGYSGYAYLSSGDETPGDTITFFFCR